MLEKEIEASVVSYARKSGVLAYKFSSPAQRGVPDRIFVFNDRVLFVEFKRTGQKPTKLQYHQMKLLQEQGQHHVYVEWCDNVHSGKHMIRTLLLDTLL